MLRPREVQYLFSCLTLAKSAVTSKILFSSSEILAMSFLNSFHFIYYYPFLRLIQPSFPFRFFHFIFWSFFCFSVGIDEAVQADFLRLQQKILDVAMTVIPIVSLQSPTPTGYNRFRGDSHELEQSKNIRASKAL